LHTGNITSSCGFCRRLGSTAKASGVV
jgi:hypothetical protein